LDFGARPCSSISSRHDGALQLASFRSFELKQFGLLNSRLGVDLLRWDFPSRSFVLTGFSSRFRAVCMNRQLLDGAMSCRLSGTR
jgi:hypothetical protein